MTLFDYLLDLGGLFSVAMIDSTTLDEVVGANFVASTSISNLFFSQCIVFVLLLLAVVFSHSSRENFMCETTVLMLFSAVDVDFDSGTGVSHAHARGSPVSMLSTGATSHLEANI